MMQRIFKVVSALALCLAVAACDSKPSNFYVLSAPGITTGATAQTTRRRGLSIGVGPVTLPEYLDRPEIVIRENATALNVADLNRWGGGLTENFQSVLGEVLSERLNTDRVLLHPWSVSGNVTYQILVQVNAFEAHPDNQVLLDARWAVVSGGTQDVIRMGRTVLREPISGAEGGAGGPDYAQITAAMSRSVARLGQEIAASGIR
ncbi:PqiC family protein [Fluviibacterium sp. S390]|uniref:PqiC family protein n=1 Tax=Fluviibacterium sp. S390 TaxID=3415139 RepID=UPI003C7BD750